MSTPLDAKDDEDLLLTRQVHPTQLEDDGTPTRTAFTPSRRDKGKLSTLHGRVPAAEAHGRHIATGYESAGSWQFSVGEAASLQLTAIEDGDEVDLEDHVSVDFVAHKTPASVKQTARKLRAAATARGCQHQP